MRRKEKDSCVTICKLPSADDSGGDTESVDSSSYESSTKCCGKKRDRNIQILFTPVSISRCK